MEREKMEVSSGLNDKGRPVRDVVTFEREAAKPETITECVYI